MATRSVAKLGDMSTADTVSTYLGTAAIYTEQDFVTLDGSLVLVVDQSMSKPNYVSHTNTVHPYGPPHPNRKVWLPNLPGQPPPLFTIQSISGVPLPVAMEGDIIWDPDFTMGGTGTLLCVGGTVGPGDGFVKSE